MATYVGLAALRTAVELRTGSLSDELWDRVAPPPYPDAFEDDDVFEIAAAVGSLDNYRAPHVQALAEVRKILGVDSGARVVVDAIRSAISLKDVLLPVIPHDHRRSRGPARRGYAGSLEPLGKLLALLVAARIISTSTVLSRRDAIAVALDIDTTGDELLGRADGDLVASLAEFVIQSSRSSFTSDYLLFRTDDQIRQAFLAETVDALESDLHRTLALISQRGIASAFGTWNKRWQRYEAEYAPAAGRSFSSSHAYRQAVVRSRKAISAFVNQPEM